MLFSTPIFLWASFIPFVQNLERPPKLDFENPPDYKAWYRDFVSRGHKDNAYDAYQGFLPTKDGGGFHEPEAPAQAQIDAFRKRLLAASKNKPLIWNDKEYPELAAYLSANAAALSVFEKASRKPHCWYPIPDEDKTRLMSLNSPLQSSSRHAANALLIRSWMQQDRQGELMVERWETCLRHAGQLAQGGEVLDGLVAMAIKAIVYQHIGAALTVGMLNPGDVDRALTTVERADSATRDCHRWYVVEWAKLLETLAYASGAGKLDPAERKRLLKETFLDLAPINKEKSRDLIEAHFARLVEIAAGPLTLSSSQQFAEFEEQGRKKHKGDYFCSTLLPSLARSYALGVRVEAMRRGTRLTLALHAHHAKHGSWPKDLKDLDCPMSAETMKVLRSDPFSGKEMRYEFKDGSPSLYSLGMDGKDDQGKHDPRWGEVSSGDYVFWPFQTKD